MSALKSRQAAMRHAWSPLSWVSYSSRRLTCHNPSGRSSLTDRRYSMRDERAVALARGKGGTRCLEGEQRALGAAAEHPVLHLLLAGIVAGAQQGRLWETADVMAADAETHALMVHRPGQCRMVLRSSSSICPICRAAAQHIMDEQTNQLAGASG